MDLRRRHADLIAHTGKPRDKALIDRADLEALDREIRAALAIADGQVQRKKGKAGAVPRAGWRHGGRISISALSVP